MSCDILYFNNYYAYACMIQCDRTTALQAVHTELLQPPTKIGIIGSGCSVATEPSAEVSRYYNLTQVSYSGLPLKIVKE